MNSIKLIPKEIFSFGWKNAKKYLLSFFVFGLVYFLSSLISPQIPKGQTPTAFQGLLMLISLIITAYLITCFYNVLIKIARGYEVKMKDFFTWPKTGFKFIWANIVAGLITILGMLPAIVGIILMVFGSASPRSSSTLTLTIIAGILFFIGIVLFFYITIRIFPTYYYVIETGSWAIPAIKKSWKNTKGHVGKIIWIAIISVGIVLLGVLAVLIGLLWAYPTIAIAYAYIYTKLFPLEPNNSEISIISQPEEIPAHTNTTEAVVEPKEDNNSSI